MGNEKRRKEKPCKLHPMTPQELLKFEIARELGLDEKVLEGGWRSLTAKESGRIGGLMTKRKKEIQREALQQE